MRWKKILSLGPNVVMCSRLMFFSSVSTATCSDLCRKQMQLSIVSSKPQLDLFFCNLSTAAVLGKQGGIQRGCDGDDSWSDDEVNAEPQFGDGGDGGGVVLRGIKWGENAFSIANDVLKLYFDAEDIKIFAFKVSPKGYIYIRLDKVSQKYGCPSIDEITHFNLLYQEKLEESGQRGEIPDNLGVEISSPSVARLLAVPSDLERFKDIPLVMNYFHEDADSHISQKRKGVFILDSIDTNARECTWKLADVKENRDPLRKGRPMSKKQKEWRLTLSFHMIERLTFHPMPSFPPR